MLEAFLDSVGTAPSHPSLDAPRHASRSQGTDLPVPHAARLHTDFHSRAGLPSCVTPSLKRSLPVPDSQPDVHLLRLLPRIRPRLTLGRRSLPRNPYAFGGADSHRPFRYSCQHSHFLPVHRPLQDGFGPTGTLLYHAATAGCIHSFGSVLQPRESSAQGLSTSELLRTL